MLCVCGGHGCVVVLLKMFLFSASRCIVIVQQFSWKQKCIATAHLDHLFHVIVNDWLWHQCVNVGLWSCKHPWCVCERETEGDCKGTCQQECGWLGCSCAGWSESKQVSQYYAQLSYDFPNPSLHFHRYSYTFRVNILYNVKCTLSERAYILCCLLYKDQWNCDWTNCIIYTKFNSWHKQISYMPFILLCFVLLHTHSVLHNQHLL